MSAAPVRALPIKRVGDGRELAATVAAQRAARPEFDNAPENLFAPLARGPRPIRCKRRDVQWHGNAHSAAAELRRRHKDQAEQINAALAEEIERGPDFLEWHRGSLFKEAPKNNLDRNFCHLRFQLDAIAILPSPQRGFSVWTFVERQRQVSVIGPA